MVLMKLRHAFAFCALLTLAGCWSAPPPRDSLSAPTFYTGDNKLLFNYQEVGHVPVVVSYDLASREFERVRFGELEPPDRLVRNASLSPDGKRLAVVVSQTRSDPKRPMVQIAITDADGTNLRKITEGPGLRSDPRFSPDGKRLIYVASMAVRREGAFGAKLFYDPRPFTDWDIWEVDIETGVETQLTDFEFFGISTPTYLPDGEHFIFSGEWPFKGKDVGPRSAYAKAYKDNHIFIFGRTPAEQALVPIVVHEATSAPTVSQDGSKIAFVSRSGKGGYSYNLFVKQGDEIRQLTHFEYLGIYSPSFSRDGARITFVMDNWSKRPRRESLWIVNTDGSGLTEIDFPPADGDISRPNDTTATLRPAPVPTDETP